MNDISIGRLARALRHRLELRQVDVGARAEMSQGLVSLIERGHLDRLSLRRLRHLFAVFDADVAIVVRWRGGEIDRLSDAAHAGMAEALTAMLVAMGWVVQPEVSFSDYGDRGSIDLLAWHPATRTLLVIELKSEIASVEETLRRHDVKVRLGPKIARGRFGWDALETARLLVVPDARTVRRQIDRHGTVFRRVYPLRTVAVRRWLARPFGPMSGILFLSNTNGGRGGHGPTGRRRIRTSEARSRGSVPCS